MSHRKSTASRSRTVGQVRATSEATVDRSSNNQNGRAVHLLRASQVDEAISILRSLVLKPGCTWMRPDVPSFVKRNFATALLLAGHPAGCLAVLAELNDETHPRVQQLRTAIKRWEKTLSFWQWLDWRTGWIEPTNRPATLEFVPGELEDELPQPETTPATSTSSHLSTAV